MEKQQIIGRMRMKLSFNNEEVESLAELLKRDDLPEDTRKEIHELCQTVVDCSGKELMTKKPLYKKQSLRMAKQKNDSNETEY